MIDTLRISGPAESLRAHFLPDQIKSFTILTLASGRESAPLTMVQRGKNYRVFMDISAERVHIEMNPHKHFFKHNIYNYEQSPVILQNYILGVSRHFFSSLSDTYLNRIDIGGVVDFQDREKSLAALETYRQTKPEGLRFAKFKSQNYETSIFYSSDNYSIKIYHKGSELARVNGQIINKVARGQASESDIIPVHVLKYADKLLRYEKTYRMDEIKRLGLKKEARYGIPLLDFKIDPLLCDFNELFAKWERQTKPYQTSKKSIAGLLQVIDNLGQLDNVASQGIVSRSTIHRYKREKKENIELIPIEWKKNLPKNLEYKFQNSVICGSFNLD